LAVDDKDEPTVQACSNILQGVVCQRRYLLKNKYFNGIPANEVPTTSHVPSISDDEWKALVAMWSTPKAKVS